jgi:NADH:ubiquinone oxidoreductase subunit 5 (subunit L)/multisubunit Na+/H+ antiporter MnhA subunit
LPAVGVAALALMGGLALACFAKVFGVVFLGEPREAGRQTHATPAGMKIAMAALGLLCVLIGVLPSLWVPLVRSATGELANVPAGAISGFIERVMAPAIRLSGMAILFVLAVGGLFVLRRWALSRAARRDVEVAPTVATWGCGYTQPTPGMQYSASSFAFSLVTTFRSLLWAERAFVAPAGSFPAAAHVETQALDIAEHELFEPIFRGVTRFYAMVRTVSWRGESESPGVAQSAAAHRRGPVRTLMAGMVSALRRGSIQVRLLFIVLTLVVLFLFEAISSRGRVDTTTGQDYQHTFSVGVGR